MNLIKILFAAIIIYLGITIGIISLWKNSLSNFLRRVFCFGKFGVNVSSPIISQLEIPKRWFKHFYIFAVPLYTFAIFLMSNKYFYNNEIPDFFLFILDISLGRNRETSVSSANTLLALILLTIHCTKRLHETLNVNVFSDAKINIAHYLVGFLHYFSLMIIIVGESKVSVRGSEVNFEDSLQIKDLLGTLIFIGMTWEQLKTNLILSNLRKNKKGVVVTKEYKLPEGRLFNYISSPLQFTEIGIYGALQIILSESSTYSFIYFWVVTNQFLCALLSHEWSQRNFKNYPTSRKIIIPFLL